MSDQKLQLPYTAIHQSDLHGPFDVVGDVHGCFDELKELIRKLGYDLSRTEGRYSVTHPEGRTLAFVGDLIDRGPKNAHCLALAIDLCEAGTALCVPGNHDDKLRRALEGRNVEISEALAQTIEQVEARGKKFRKRVQSFLSQLPYHYLLDEGRLGLVHAALPHTMRGKRGKKARAIMLFGETTGGVDPQGYPERLDWTRDYQGSTYVVYGHTPVLLPYENNNTVNVDTGCVFGNQLTAVRYPERRFVAVDAKRAYSTRKGFLNREVRRNA